MGTTRQAMEAGGGRFCFVLVVEGFSKLITDHASLSAVTTAWSGTSWSSAIAGLRIEGSIEQEIRPWSNDIPVSTLKFIINGSQDSDDFGDAVWKAKAAAATRLTSPFDAESGATTVSGQSIASFPSSGTFYIGNSAVTYTSRTATAFTIPSGALGVFAPFTIDSPPADFFWPRPSQIGNQTVYDASLAPKISDSPRTWVGRWVGLWMHRISGTTLDTKANAELLFAGKITNLSETTDGATVVEAEDLRGVIRDTAIYDTQFRGYVKEGIRLAAGDSFVAVIDSSTSNALSVVSSGGSSPSSVDEGYYKLEDYVGILNAWLAAEYTAGRIGYRTSVTITGQDANASKAYLRCEGLGVFEYAEIRCTCGDYLIFLDGTDTGQGVVNTGDYYGIGGYGGPTPWVSTSAPWRTWLYQPRRGSRIELDSSSIGGEWADNSAALPHPFQSYTESGEDRGFLLVDGMSPVFAMHTSDTVFDDVVYGVPYSIKDASNARGRRDGEDPKLEIKQLFWVGGSFRDVLTKFLVSVQGNGVNHATYDSLPWGCAIPWELLGTNWIDSCANLAEANDTSGIAFWLDKPTKILELFLDQIILRFAFFVFKEGTLQLISPRTPNATNADWEFDETNKGAPTGERMNLAASTRISSEYMRNVVKVEYDRVPGSDTYQKKIEFRDAGSIADHGVSQTLSIRCRNTFSEFAGTGANVHELASSLIARCAPIFGRPVRMFRRSMNGTLFAVCPGDTGSLTDEFARDPTTGTRGVSARGVTVLRTMIDFGHEGGEFSGEVDLMFAEEDRSFPMAPCAEFDETKNDSGYSNGWNAGSRVIFTTQHAFSRSSDSIDASHFTAGDEILVVEVDPSDPTSADSFSDTIVSISSNAIFVTNGFGVGGRPAFSTSKRYRVTFDTYTTVGTNQKDNAFTADETDGQILDTIEPNLYTDQTSNFAFEENDLNEDFVYHNDDVVAEGHALSTGNLRDLVRNLNNVVNYTCAYSVPMNDDSAAITFTPANTLENIAVQCFRVPGNLAPWPAGYKRDLTIAARFLSSGGGSTNQVRIRVTVSTNPPNGTSFSKEGSPPVSYPYRSVTFTTSSTTSVEVTATTVPPVSGYTGDYYVLVEGGIDDAAVSGQFVGITKFQLGPLEAI